MPALIHLALSVLQMEGVSPPFTARVPSSASAYDLRGLAPGQEYQVTVRALRGTNWGPPASKTITTSESWGCGVCPEWRSGLERGREESAFQQGRGEGLGGARILDRKLMTKEPASHLILPLSIPTSDRWPPGPPGSGHDSNHAGAQLAAPPGRGGPICGVLCQCWKPEGAAGRAF